MSIKLFAISTFSDFSCAKNFFSSSKINSIDFSRGTDSLFDKVFAISFTVVPLLIVFKISAVVCSKIKYSLRLSNQTIVLFSNALYKKFDFFFIKNKSNYFMKDIK